MTRVACFMRLGRPLLLRTSVKPLIVYAATMSLTAFGPDNSAGSFSPHKRQRQEYPHERAEQSAEAIAKSRLARRVQRSLRGIDKIDKRSHDCSRFLMVLSYDGDGFHGWQKQKPRGQEPPRTVEGVLEECLRPVLSQPLKFWPSGRTDAGVSATGQVANFDAVVPETTRAGLVEAFNDALPDDVRCISLTTTHKTFSANECLWKRYVYRIEGDASTVHASCLKLLGYDEVGVLAAVNGGVSGAPLELEAMRLAAERLQGSNDFASFQSKGGRSTTVRTLYRCDVRLGEGDEGCTFTLEGDGFLYNMVRIIVGTLIQVGLGRRSVDEVAGILQATDRARAGPTAPAVGLCLEHVEYDRPWTPLPALGSVAKD